MATSSSTRLKPASGRGSRVVDACMARLYENAETNVRSV